MTYLPDNTDYSYKVWNYGYTDALSFESCKSGTYHDNEELKNEYLNGYAKGMDSNNQVFGGVAPPCYRDGWDENE